MFRCHKFRHELGHLLPERGAGARQARIYESDGDPGGRGHRAGGARRRGKNDEPKFRGSVRLPRRSGRAAAPGRLQQRQVLVRLWPHKAIERWYRGCRSWGAGIACVPPMPELPEVETVMRGLRARLEGRRIVRAVAHRPDLRWPLPPNLARRLTGARVLGFRRRGKYILMRLDDGDSVLLHLGMSGRMLIEKAGRNDVTLHEHLVLETDEGWCVGFVDPRRFGSIDLVPTAQEDAHRLLAELGPEPLHATFSAASL